MTNKVEQPTKEPTLLQQILRGLGGKNGVVEETLRRLREKGITVGKSALYQVLNGRSSRPELVETFLEVAEEARNRKKQMDERARQLLANA